jgi:hypothetical protein
MNSRRILLVLLAVFLGGGIGLSWYLDRQEAVVESPTTPSALAIKRIRVISGHEFDIVLENGKRFKGQLEVATPTGSGSEVVKKVTELLNSATNPKVVWLSEDGKIDILLTVNNKELSLSKWLKDNKLVWEVGEDQKLD